MGRVAGTFPFSANFEVNKEGAFDARLVVQYKSDLIAGIIPYPYNGMPVAVTEDPTPANNGLWLLLDKANVTDYASWTRVGTGSLTASDISDFTPAVQSIGDVRYALASHTHSAADIVSGTIAYARLGANVTLAGNTFNAADKLLQLNSSAKIDAAFLPDSLLGQVIYQGTYNAATNTPALPDPTTSLAKYYIVTTAGTYGGIAFSVGDWVISDGNIWDKVDNTDSVFSVFGRTGNIVPANGDYTASQVGFVPFTGISSTNVQDAIEAVYAATQSGGVYVSAYGSTIAVPYDVGRITAGTLVSALNNSTNSQMWDKLLFAAVNPILNAPSFGLGLNIGALQEISNSVSATLSAQFNRGTIFQPWNNATQNFRAGASSNYNFTGQGSLNVNQVGSSYAHTFTVVQGANNFASVVTFGVGPQPVNNLGTNFSTPLAAGTLSANASIEGVYALYATTDTITSQTKQGLVSMISGNNIQISLAAESGGNKQAFWIPNAWLTNRALTSVQYFNTVSNQFDATNQIGDFTTNTQTIGGVSYTKYTYTGSNRGGITIRLIF